MAADIHPLASHNMPAFITAPGETDVLFNVTIGIVIAAVVFLGVLYFKIHALPEHIAHRTTKIQYEIVAVLGLLSLFTHEHIYWIIGLLLALIELPDFSTPLTGMADSLAKMARGTRSALIGIPPIESSAPAPPVIERAHEKPAKKRDLTHA